MRKEFLKLVFAIVAFAIITYFILGSITQSPGSSLHELGGDGIKNYYTYLQHALYGHGWWSTGMNYPYGEHIMFVDGQPLLSMSLAALRPYVNIDAEVITATLNLLMAFSFFLALVFVYKILTRYKVHYLWAIILSCCVIFLSHQNTSMFGHYGLSYVSVMPMMLYWLLCYYDTSRLKYAVFIFVLACILMMLHPYNLAYIMIWIIFYSLGYVILNRESFKKRFQHVLPLIISFGIAFLIFKLITVFTDPYTDRPTYPHGLGDYIAFFKDLFMSSNSPYWVYLNEEKIVGEKLNYSFIYIGVTTMLVLVIALAVKTIRYFRKSQTNSPVDMPDFPGVFLFLGFFALLFSMGVPYIWGMDWLLDYVAALRQFRSLDRFGLIFYQISSVFTAIVLYRLISNSWSNKKYILTVLLTIAVASWGYEGYSMMKRNWKRSMSAGYNFNFAFGHTGEQPWEKKLQQFGYKASDFQAILHVPYIHIGSEKIWLQNGNWSLTLATKAAIQLNLPLVDANMSRSSWKQTFEQIKISGGPYTEKTILDNIKDSRPFLMLVDLELENPNDRYLMSVADSITQTSEVKVFALYPEKLRKSDTAAMAAFRQMTENMPMGDSSTLGGGHYYYNHFDSAGSNVAFYGKQSMPSQDTNMMIVNLDIRNWPKEVQYESSAWFKVNARDHASPSLEMHLLDSNWQNLGIHGATVAQSSTDNHGMWFRAMCYFSIPANCRYMQVYLQTGKRIVYTSMDEILIRQVNDTILSKNNSGQVMINNHRLLPARK